MTSHEKDCFDYAIPTVNENNDAKTRIITASAIAIMTIAFLIGQVIW